MLRYEKLPKSTSWKAKTAVVVCGIGLGLALFTEGFITLYGLVGLFSLYFYPSSNLVLTGGDILILSLIAITAAVATTMLGFLAYYMNRLDKRALPLSRIIWIPMLVSVVVVLWQRTDLSFTYHLSWMWIWMGYEAIILAGVLPVVFLHTRAGRALHNR